MVSKAVKIVDIPQCIGVTKTFAKILLFTYFYYSDHVLQIASVANAKGAKLAARKNKGTSKQTSRQTN